MHVYIHIRTLIALYNINIQYNIKYFLIVYNYYLFYLFFYHLHLHSHSQSPLIFTY